MPKNPKWGFGIDSNEMPVLLPEERKKLESLYDLPTIEQFVDINSRTNHQYDTPEVRLATAILERAMTDIIPRKKMRHALKNGGVTCFAMRQRARVARRGDQARKWMEADDTTYVFSFSSICHLLNINPDLFRRRFLGAASQACSRREEVVDSQECRDKVSSQGDFLDGLTWTDDPLSEMTKNPEGDRLPSFQIIW